MNDVYDCVMNPVKPKRLMSKTVKFKAVKVEGFSRVNGKDVPNGLTTTIWMRVKP